MDILMRTGNPAWGGEMGRLLRGEKVEQLPSLVILTITLQHDMTIARGAHELLISARNGRSQHEHGEI